MTTKPHPPILRRVEPSNGGLMNADFKYVKHSDSDLSKSFARARKAIKEAEAAKAPKKIAAVAPMKRRAA